MTAPQRDRWFTRWPAAAPRLRLICLPYAGAMAAAFADWPAALAPFIELIAVELPGRGRRLKEQPYVRIDDLIPALLDALQPAFEPPFAIFGHSLGALIAFELARALRAARLPRPGHLFLSGHTPPRLTDHGSPVAALPAESFVDWLRSCGGTPPEILADAELLELVLPVLRADVAVVESHRYRAQEPLAMPITAYSGANDQFAPTALMAGWQAETTGTFALKELPGAHFFLRTASVALLSDIGATLVGLIAGPPGQSDRAPLPGLVTFKTPGIVTEP
jgi:medium-chain acyl-[acyl-carrier-protein] hydrolase